MGISQVYGAVNQLAARGVEMIKARPISSFYVAGIGIKTIKAAFSEEKEDKVSGSRIVIWTLKLLALEKLEPFLIQGQLYKYPASTLMGTFAGSTLLDRVLLKEDKKKQETLNLSVFVSYLLLSVGLRKYGPTLFTHRYLAWLR